MKARKGLGVCVCLVERERVCLTYVFVRSFVGLLVLYL